MTCQFCGVRPATTHLKRTINGETTELHICNQCAAEQGIHLWDSFGLNMGDFWGNLFGTPAISAGSSGDTVRCEGCGHSFADIAESGQVGCPECYTTFFDRLLPSIRQIHGKAPHAGKIPDEAETGEQRRERQIEQLKKELNTALEQQDYETCAKLRDQIKELEGAEQK